MKKEREREREKKIQKISNKKKINHKLKFIFHYNIKIYTEKETINKTKKPIINTAGSVLI